jgi:hypothetical protein
MTSTRVARVNRNGIAHDIESIEVDGRRIAVSLRISFDGVEHLGRLWFRDELALGVETVDRSVVPGHTPEEVMARARVLTRNDLAERYKRAIGEKRRFSGLRTATNDVLDKIRSLNRVALSLQTGLLDSEEAAHEIDAIEAELHQLVGRLRDVAGVQDSIGEPTE